MNEITENTKQAYSFGRGFKTAAAIMLIALIVMVLTVIRDPEKIGGLLVYGFLGALVTGAITKKFVMSRTLLVLTAIGIESICFFIGFSRLLR